MSDLLHYFRIEARELIDELAGALSGLARGGPAAGLAGTGLRHAHTLKGAARVVGFTGMADRVHELEEMLGPYRTSAGPVPAEVVQQMQALVDRLSDELGAPEPSSAPEPLGVVPAPRAGPALDPVDLAAVPALSPVPAPATAVEATRAQELANTAQTARASLLEIDSLIDGVGQTRTQLGTVREGARRARRLRTTAQDRLTDEQADELSWLARNLETSADRIERELREVYTTAERLRLIPVETIVPDLERGVRDVTAAQGKRARLEVHGAELSVDATVLAGAQTALRQIVRNAVAHGVETPEQRTAVGKDPTGRVRVEITHGAHGVRFRCADDGRGVDLAAVRRRLVQAGRAGEATLDDEATLRLLLGSGISTATTVSEISGHGIGLDVVQDVVRRIGGRIEISTVPGEGTTIDLIAPASMTAQEVVLVRATSDPPEELDRAGRGGSVVAVPLRAVRQARRVSAQDFSGPLAVMHDGRRIPWMPLADVLGPLAGSGGPDGTGRTRTVLVLDGQDGPVAVGVDRLVGTAEIAVRPLPALAPVPPLVCGIWIDIDGRPRPVLDPAHLATEAATRRVRRPASLTAPVARRTSILIVDDSLTSRMLERTILESAGYQVDQAGSAEEGLAMATRKRYAVAVVDVEMPGLDGFAFIEQTRTRRELRHMPCILVTTKASPADRERGRAAGARGHIDKGQFHQSALLDAVGELVAEGDS
ncbi:response regulator [Kineosporia sp. NBRC 101731]|uniref:hybrid sensor histidine kinase/response regulator n=1 Tax=Kineosporia sp. NBRC 101731 TaxID=3032199 RepID=UPI0024A414C4|nr:response regulator [Kineosporia sp. NBRC 101731]GLY31395.1 hybrid sensor histidine kinase/response regulator [Kineosporia sp. NBRC 101731]